VPAQADAACRRRRLLGGSRVKRSEVPMSGLLRAFEGAVVCAVAFRVLGDHGWCEEATQPSTLMGTRPA